MLSKEDVKRHAIPLVLYLVIAMVFFAPVLLNPNDVFLGYLSEKGAFLQTVYVMQEFGPFETMNPYINAPFGSNLTSYGLFMPSVAFIVLPLSLLTTPLVAYNLMMFAAIFSSAIAMYFFAWNFIKSRQACFISGLVYGFSSYFFARALIFHINLVWGAWIVLYALMLFRFYEKKNTKNALLLGFSLFLVGFFSYYYLYFAVIFTALFYLYKLWKKSFRIGRHELIAAATFLFFFLIVLFPFLLLMISDTEQVFRSVLGGRTGIMNAVYLSAWPQQLLTPSVYHPLFKEAVTKINITLPGMNFTGATIFLGFTAVALSLFALFKLREDKTVRFFLFLAVAGLILATGPFMRYVPALGLTLTFVPALLALYSLYTGHKKFARLFSAIFILLLFFPLLYSLLPLIQGPATDIIGLQQLKDASVPEIVSHFEKYSVLPIPMPSLFLFLAAPMFRMLARLSLFVLISVAVLAGFGMELLLKRVNNSSKGLALTLLFTALILFEALTFPPYLITDVSETPAQYAWLAEQPGQPIVLEYPFERLYFYMYYQPYHKKPLMNGDYSAKFKKLKKHILDPTDSETLSILAGFGVKYIVTHDDFFLESIPDYIPEKGYASNWMFETESGPFVKKLDEGYKNVEGIKLVKKFPHANIYEITAEPKEFSFE